MTPRPDRGFGSTGEGGRVAKGYRCYVVVAVHRPLVVGAFGQSNKEQTRPAMGKGRGSGCPPPSRHQSRWVGGPWPRVPQAPTQKLVAFWGL